MEGPLKGIRVLDLTRYVAGPFATAYLGDLGAEVIRIEPSRGGDDRFTGPLTAVGANPRFLILARNKKGITLDIYKDKGMELFHRLVAISDIVVENNSPPVKEKLGLTYENLRRLKEDIILVSMSAYGSDGPSAHRVGFDHQLQAEMGYMLLNGFADGPPIRAQTPWLDQSTAVNSIIGVLLALMHRSRTGEGQYIETCLIDSAAFHLGMSGVFAEYEICGLERPRIGNVGYMSFGNTYATKDGWITITTAADSIFRRLAKAVGRPDWIEDPRFHDNTSRYLNRDVMEPYVVDWAASKTSAEAVAIMEAARVPCARACTTVEGAANKQVAAREMFEALPVEGVGPINHPRLPIRMNRTPMPLERGAAMLGEHNADIFGGLLGLSDAEMASLKAEDVI